MSIPNVEHSLAVYYLVATAEASSNLARYDGVRYGFRAAGAGDVGSAIAASRTEGFGPEVQRRILLGSHALSAGNYTAYFDKAMRVRTLIRRDIEAVLAECDCFVSPTAPTTALRIGELVEDPLTMYLQDIYTIVANLVGVPALSVPCGLHGGLPVGFQVFGPMFGETMLFRVAAAVEQASAGEMRRPELEVM
ncbi:MAG: Glutamyl-tRNA(Gln) amidotransferase subunit A [Firmicutes bacterium ADurb.Bin506]|nr:MAG: Glutamyl-tRNA(Gln) amidotransferase subunit A [Firmicutes bacterium ADurb.Bin506]